MSTHLRVAVAGLAACLLLIGCSDSRRADPGAVDLAMSGPNPDDHDGDGYTPSMGDCNDGDPAIGPMAFEVPGNGIDDDCNGKVDEVIGSCDGSTAGKTDAPSLAAAIGFCESRFLVKSEMRGPSDVRARAITPKFGLFTPLEGATLAVISTGIAADKSMPGWVRPQDGTILDQNNKMVNPDPAITGPADCGSTPQPTVYDYTELALTVHVPQNANSLSFQLQFFSAEYPEFVCHLYNDELLVELESTKGGTKQNISFDSMMNAITVNTSLFTICMNDMSKPQTNHCTQSIDGLAGTGYEDMQLSMPIGGSTGWLRTSAPVIPGDDITLRFIIFDEGDHIFDSVGLIDKFAWSTAIITGPVTIP